jgi:two-component system sensor histidine kinase TctE
MAQREPQLQRQLLKWLLVPLLALLVLDTVVMYWTSLNFSNLAHDRSLHEIGREIVLHVKPDARGPRLELTPAAEQILLTDPQDRLFFKLSTEAGAVVGGDPALAVPPPALSKDGKPLYYGARLRGEEVRAGAWWAALGDGNAPQLVLVQVAETVNKRNQLAWEILVNAIVPQLLLIFMATGAVYLGVSRGLRPLRRLAHAVSHRSHLDLSPIDTHGVPGEVRPLVEEVNELMTRLGRILDFQTRFVADAAHQLKTPVSGLKAQIEMALREEDPQRVRHSLAQLYVGADRMSRLVLQLLALARNEPAAARTVQLEVIDLRALAMSTSMEWVPHALKTDIDLGFEGPDEPVMVEGDADRLREMVNNLVDNAIRYSQQGGRVTVTVERLDDTQGRLSVSDDGQRIPVAERSRIFERFHRLLGTQMDGSGLGLAIVSEIAALHKARIVLEDDGDGVGNRFSVLFPLWTPARQAGL